MKAKLSVVKIGGNVLNDENLLKSCLQSFRTIEGAKILVHGGGTLLNSLAEQLGHTQQMHQGRRITDAKSLQLAVMVYAGWINKSIVSTLQSLHCTAIGLCGADLNILPATKRKKGDVDYGEVGDINQADVGVKNLRLLLEMGAVPVFSAITHSAEGQLLNTNADTIAAALAEALNNEFEVHLFYCFEKQGVLKNVREDASVIPFLTQRETQLLVETGLIHSGMLPKLQMGFAALQGGVAAVTIGHANNLIAASQGKGGTQLCLEHSVSNGNGSN